MEYIAAPLKNYLPLAQGRNFPIYSFSCSSVQQILIEAYALCQAFSKVIMVRKKVAMLLLFLSL